MWAQRQSKSKTFKILKYLFTSKTQGRSFSFNPESVFCFTGIYLFWDRVQSGQAYALPASLCILSAVPPQAVLPHLALTVSLAHQSRGYSFPVCQ